MLRTAKPPRRSAVELIHESAGELLMKGSLHTDELMREVASSKTGLRTARRISHVFVMDVPTYAETLFITDAAINIFPDLDAKRDIVQNAIDLFTAGRSWHAARRHPVRGRDRDVEDSVDHRGSGAVQDGRPRPDHRRRCSMARWPSTTRSIRRRRGSRASSPRLPAARRSWSCPISKRATCWPRTSIFLAKADSAGIVLGARVPIILTSRADSVRARMASCAAAVLYADARRSKRRAAGGLTPWTRSSSSMPVRRASSSRCSRPTASAASTRLIKGQVDGIGTQPRLRASAADGIRPDRQNLSPPMRSPTFRPRLRSPATGCVAIATSRRWRSDTASCTAARLRSAGSDRRRGAGQPRTLLISLAPLHQPNNLAPIRAILASYPGAASGGVLRHGVSPRPRCAGGSLRDPEQLL